MVTDIPNLALSIPDFEGTATIRIFSNATETQIGCFRAIMRNGNSFSHPAVVSTVLGFFTTVALVASFATAIYGISVPQIRTHYAHSLSVLVVFEVFQSIFFSGALSLQWPSVLPAFWSNFAWSGGQIYTAGIINSINGFVGVSGNSSQVGGAGSVDLNTGGGLQQQIYGRSLQSLSSTALWTKRSEDVAKGIYKRLEGEEASQFSLNSWAGSPVDPGLPAPGSWDGFTGELAQMRIPAADAFLNGLIWFLILVGILVGAVALFKWSIELFSHMKVMKQGRFVFFRSHWLGFIGLIVLRSMLIAFFMIMTLTLFQFSYGGKAGVLAIATIVFVIFFGGSLCVAFYACYSRLRFGKDNGKEKSKSAGSVSFFRWRFVDSDSERQSVHRDEDYIKRFGWLSARFRRTRWWFIVVWIIYQFVRACFIGGAREHQVAQVIGIFVWEIIAFVAIIVINPFESARITALAVYMLGLSKVATAGLSIAFLPRLNIARIPATVIGVIIIVIQGLLVIGLLILIVLGAISTYMSVTRNREHITPRDLETLRLKYFDVIDKKANDLPPPPPPAPEEPQEPYFSVLTVHRAPKIEDEDDDVVPDIALPDYPDLQAAQPHVSLPNRASRASSFGSHRSAYGSVPFGARVHRASWSSRDFHSWQEERTTSLLNSTQRQTSGHNTANNSVSNPPMVRSAASQSSLRLSTPTSDQPEKPASRSVAFAE